MKFTSKTTFKFNAAGKGSGRLASLFGLTKKAENNDESLIGLISRMNIDHETSKEVSIEEAKGLYDICKDDIANVEENMQSIMAAAKICNNSLLQMVKEDVSEIYQIQKEIALADTDEAIAELEIKLKLRRAQYQNRKDIEALEKEFGMHSEKKED